MFAEPTDAPLAAKLAHSIWTSDRAMGRRQKSVKRSILTSSLAACFVVAFAVPQGAAETPSDSTANQCLTDLRVFHDQMQTDGYWLGGYNGAGDTGLGAYSYGYGYPLGGYG